MLVFHFGMPKTGTTALQRALAGSREALGAAGIAYPELFCDEHKVAHHALPVALYDDRSLADSVSPFFDYLAAEDAQSILVSSEAFTNIVSMPRVERLAAFLSECSKTRPVRIVFALRRIDDFMQSMYLHSIKHGSIKYAIDQYLHERHRWVDSLFSSIAILQRDAMAELRLVKYRAAPAYLSELLAACGIDKTVRDTLAPIGIEGRRMSLKAQSVLYCLEQIGKEINRPLMHAKIHNALRSGQIRFEGDTDRYTIMDEYQTFCFHERALRAAYQYDIQAYVDFFLKERIEMLPRHELGRDSLDARDLDVIRSLPN